MGGTDEAAAFSLPQVEPLVGRGDHALLAHPREGEPLFDGLPVGVAALLGEFLERFHNSRQRLGVGLEGLSHRIGEVCVVLHERPPSRTERTHETRRGRVLYHLNPFIARRATGRQTGRSAGGDDLWAGRGRDCGSAWGCSPCSRYRRAPRTRRRRRSWWPSTRTPTSSTRPWPGPTWDGSSSRRCARSSTRSTRTCGSTRSWPPTCRR